MMHAPAARVLRARLLASARPVEGTQDRPLEDLGDFFKRIDFPGRPRVWRRGGVAVVEVRGTILPNRAAFASEIRAFLFGGTILDDLTATIGELVADRSVGGILLSVDSPGGYADGVAQAAAEIRAASKAKPVGAHTSGMMDSAAYYLGCAVSPGQLSASTGAEVGSIGVVIPLVDDREAMAMLGLEEIPFISEASPDKWPDPKTEHGAALFQQAADEMGRQFVRDVAKYRGTTVDAVRADFGRGWVLSPARAKAVGMIDRISSLDRAIQRLGDAAAAQGGKAAKAPAPAPAAARATLGRIAATLGPAARPGLAATLGAIPPRG